MQLYFMELYKVCRRKIVWAIAGIVLFLLLLLFGQIYGNKKLWIEEFGAAAGYRAAMDNMQFVYTYLSVWLIIALSSIFAEDHVSHVKATVFTTEKGRNGVYYARIKAAFTITAISYICMSGLTMAVCGFIYGYQDGNKEVSVIYPYTIGLAQGLADQSIISFFWKYLFISFGAFLMLAVIIIWISACSKTVVSALLGAFFVYLVPTVLENMAERGSMNPIYVIVTGQPVLLVVTRCMEESWAAYWWHVCIIIGFLFMGIWCGRKQWGKTLK